MFRDRVGIIDPITEQYVNSLHRLDMEPDYSLTNLGIAMLKPRMENYDGIGGAYKHYEEEYTCVCDFISSYTNRKFDGPTLFYYRYGSFNSEMDEKIQDELNSVGFETKLSITKLMKDKADVRCTVAYRKDENYAGIFINSGDFRFYHLLLSFISLMFPAVFEGKPLTKEEYELVKTLNKTELDAFTMEIRKAVQPYAIDFTRMMLSNLLKSMHDKKISNALTEVQQQRSTLEILKRNYTDAMDILKRLIVTYEGMKATEFYDQPEEDLVEYLSTNKLLHNLKIEGSKLYFTVATLLNNYNADAWNIFSDRGYIYDGIYKLDGYTIELLDVFKEKNNRKILLDNIFSEIPEFAVKIAGNYSFNFENCGFYTSRDYNYCTADPIYKSYLPNPHLKIFGCLGGYEGKVIDALVERNYIAAVEMCCASAGSVDLDETEQTFRPFIGWIMSSREKILRRRDGTDMTPEEALIYLIDKENNK